jgi:hypothetical protein
LVVQPPNDLNDHPQNIGDHPQIQIITILVSIIFFLQITSPRQPVTLAMGTPQNIVHGAYTTDRRFAFGNDNRGMVLWFFGLL